MTNKKLNEWLFKKVHMSTIVYNTCWEDPQCDRKLLQLDENSSVVMLTSAGCNALDYLLDNPKIVHCIDMNPKQNALLDLKLAIFKSSIGHSVLFDLFGTGGVAKPKKVIEKLQDHFHLDYTTEFWTKNAKLFNNQKGKKSFYWRGSSGTVAWWCKKYFDSKSKMNKLLDDLFSATELSVQTIAYNRVERRFFTPFVKRIFNSQLVQNMLGVPKAQQFLAEDGSTIDMATYAQQRMRHVFTNIPIESNYFWRVYLKGQYTHDCCPNYLKEENYINLTQKSHRIHLHTSTVSQFLQDNPNKYTHFVLLDHLDWLAGNDKAALEEEWRLIFENSAPNAVYLFRSAASDVHFLPSWIKEKLVFDDKAAQDSDANDRVGTYAGTFIARLAPVSTPTLAKI